MDVLPRFIVLMLASPPMLWGPLRFRNITLLASVMLYLAARQSWKILLQSPKRCSGSFFRLIRPFVKKGDSG
jgi:hypothetical protein